MYPAKYNTCLRIHSPEEALLLPNDAKGADLWLGVLDTYDCLCACIRGEIPLAPETAEKIREKFMKMLVLRYNEDFVDRIPGSPPFTPHG